MRDTGSLASRIVLSACLAAGLFPHASMAADTVKTVPAGTPVTITVTQAQPASPPVSITLRERHGHGTPVTSGCVHTGGGTIDIQQPSADTVVITMTGVAVAYCGSGGAVASMTFDLNQCFEVGFDSPKVKKAKLALVESRVIGLLRSHCKGGSAEFSNACASVMAGPLELVTVCLPPHSVAGGENLSVNDHAGPNSVPVAAGKYTYVQRFTVTASAPKCLLPCKAPSSEFAPDALNPLWISAKEPFRGATKKDFGFQVTLKVVDDTPAEEQKSK